mgnify:CR=1 FL=1
MKKTFRIDYDYGHIRDKRIEVHNCINEFDAKCRLHDFLVKKHGTNKLIIHKCEEDIFKSFDGMFGNIFNS